MGKLTAYIIKPDNTILKKKIKAKDYRINIDGATYVISNKDILLYNGFLGIKRYIFFYNNDPIAVTSDLGIQARNEKVQKLINAGVLGEFLKTNKMDMTLILLVAIVGAIMGAFIGYEIHSSVSAPTKTVIGSFIMAKWGWLI